MPRVAGGRKAPPEEAVLWRDPDLYGTEMLRASYTTFEFTPHAHETFAIGVTERGAQTFTSRRHRRLVMPAGTIALVNPGEVHTSRALDARGWSYRMLYPAPALLQEIADDVRGRRGELPFFASAVVDDPRLAARIKALLVACELPHTPALERESRLRACLADLVIRHGRRPGEPARVRIDGHRLRGVRDLLDACPGKVTLRELADLAGISPYHLLRLFREAFGLPPHAYLIQARVERAKRALCGGASIVDAALGAGFVDQSHLTRYFKRLTGVTPGLYASGSASIR